MYKSWYYSEANQIGIDSEHNAGQITSYSRPNTPLEYVARLS